MGAELILKKVSTYALVTSVDEWRNEVKGYYKDENIAHVDAKGSGWFGGDGKVEIVDMYEDQEGNIYDVTFKGKYTDVDREYRSETIDKIKSKLTLEECKLLGL